jgi:hypothetical protein
MSEDAMTHVRSAPDPSVQRLAELLMLEYAGALPPGQVLSTVYRANWILSTGTTALPVAARASTLEAVVRRMLTDRLAALQVRPLQAQISA